VDNGWIRSVLEHHVATGLHRRIGAAPSNFDQQLDPLEAEQAQEIVKDPYVFDFLGLTDRATERAIEQALTDRLQETLAELGQGFAFVGRQHRLSRQARDLMDGLITVHRDLEAVAAGDEPTPVGAQPGAVRTGYTKQQVRAAWDRRRSDELADVDRQVVEINRRIDQLMTMATTP
jgi:predicted nuclease of restriction endonuclease-like (RecB) superfamily